MIVTTSASGVSLVIAAVALLYAKRSAEAARQSVHEAGRSAVAAEASARSAAITAAVDRAQDRRERHPELLVSLTRRVAHDATMATYRIINDGPSDLDSLVVHRPVLGRVEGRIIHPVAAAGGEFGDSCDLGPVAHGDYGEFVLSLGAPGSLPEFRVKIVMCRGDEEWNDVVLLDRPRPDGPIEIGAYRTS